MLVGATTENPSFEVNSALLSRVEGLRPAAARRRTTWSTILTARAGGSRARPRRARASTADDAALTALAVYANGDARVALNLLEQAVAALPADGGRHAAASMPPRSPGLVERRALLYDKAGEEHYNIISALHKSIRNSDADAAHLLARAHARSRRGSALRRPPAGAVRVRGHRQRRSARARGHARGQGRRALSRHARSATRRSPRRSSTWRPRRRATRCIVAYGDAARDATEDVAAPVPLHLRNAPTRLMKDLGYGEGLPVRARRGRRRRGDVVPARAPRGTPLLPAHRSRHRESHQGSARTRRGDPQTAAGLSPPWLGAWGLRLEAEVEAA